METDEDGDGQAGDEPEEGEEGEDKVSKAMAMIFGIPN